MLLHNLAVGFIAVGSTENLTHKNMNYPAFFTAPAKTSFVLKVTKSGDRFYNSKTGLLTPMEAAEMRLRDLGRAQGVRDLRFAKNAYHQAVDAEMVEVETWIKAQA